MKKEIIEYAKYQLEKSKEAYRASELLYKNDSLTASVNRIYYAVFYSVSALMCLYGFSTSKHSGMLSNFNKEIANKGLINKEHKVFYRDMFDKRQKGDYDVYKFSNEDVKEWLDKAEDFINTIEALTLKMIKEDETAKKDGGFTLIELVMTILLIGILSIGLYQVVMWGINDYMTNEHYLHSNNSMTQAMATIRRNLENAAMPPTPPQTFSVSGVCPFNKPTDEPSQTNPICVFSSFNTGAGCNKQGIGNEISFFQLNQKTGNYELIVYCVVNNILYKEVNSDVPTSYPVADNISSIIF